MADNVAITAGAGTVVAADDVGGVLFQRVKITWGVDATANDVNATTPLPVTLSTVYTEDAAAAADPVGSALILVRADTLSVVTVSADGDNIAARATSAGELHTKNLDLEAVIAARLPLNAASVPKFELVDSAGLSVDNSPPDTGTQSSVAAAVASTTLKLANANRWGLSIENDSSASLDILCGAGTASATARTKRLAPGGYFEVPYSYTGIVSGIWTSATGSARVTEFV